MKVENHWLVGEAGDVYAPERVKGAPKKRPVIVPTLVLVHFGVTSTLESLIAAQRAPRPDSPEGYWAHLSIDGWWGDPDNLTRSVYRVAQALPFNARGIHAGKSEFMGRQGCNDFAIGIEIANPGPLVRNPHTGALVTTYGATWPEDDAIQARHKNPDCRYEYWAKYSDQEYDIIVDVIRALKAAYPTITHVAGHDDVSPGRKIDPGPVLNLGDIRRETGLQ